VNAAIGHCVLGGFRAFHCLSNSLLVQRLSLQSLNMQCQEDFPNSKQLRKKQPSFWRDIERPKERLPTPFTQAETCLLRALFHAMSFLIGDANT
jgi:hypothetical protein